jgi:DNA polymerase-1
MASTFLLIDGHSLAFRSYFAHAKGQDGGLRTSTGIPTSATYGFLKALMDTIAQEQPDHVAIAFDLDDPTFRHEADETYKEGRPEAPEDFGPDMANLHEVLDAMKLKLITAPGYEADDIIGTLAQQASEAGFRVKILTGDRDLFQLVDSDRQVSILYMSTTYGKGTPPPREFGVEQVKEKMGILPNQVVDYKALCGDKSDNIPGVKGVGDKTAVNLLTTYGTLEKIYDSLDEIKGATRKKLEAGKEDALRSQYLAQIHLQVPLEIELGQCKLTDFEDAAVTPLLEKLEFRSFRNSLPQWHQLFGGTEEITSASDLSTSEQATSNPPPQQNSSGVDNSDESSDVDFFTAEETDAAQQNKLKLQPRIVDTPEKLTELVKLLENCTDLARPVAWDTETTSLEPRDAKLVGLGCCWGDTVRDLAYIPINHKQGTNLDRDLVLDTLRPILESDAYPKALQNAKFDRLILRCQGIHLAGVVFDTMLASYVLNPEEVHNLGELGLRYLGIDAKSYSELVGKDRTIADISISEVADYCGTDAYTVFHLVPKLRSQLAEIPKLQQLLLDVEQPLEPVLADMEYLGVCIDQGYLAEFSAELERDLLAIEQKAYDVSGHTFNLGSPKQLSELLFETLGLDKRKSKKRATGYSTDAATLEKLQGDHEVIDCILEYRTLAKLKSTYVDALPALVRPDTHRVHTDYNQAVTATGRLSSSKPNLQNIPIRTEFSRQIRKAFIPQDGWLLAAADYSQIELRILAHLSQEPILLETYQNGGDIHTVTARLLFEKDDITPDERRLAKTINFGVIYGMGAQRFARESGYSTAEAKTFIERFNDRYSRVFAYLQQMQKEAIANGYVETILGRRRYFNFNSDHLKKLRGSDPEAINLDKLKLRDQYEAQLLRAAANAPIQGSSADIIKVAMVQLSQQLQGRQANLLLQVHDELVFEIHPEEWEDLQPQIKATMENAISLTVPLVVEIHAGANWMEAK